MRSLVVDAGAPPPEGPGRPPGENEESRRGEEQRKELAELLVHDLKAPIAGASLNIELALDLLGGPEAPVVEALQDALLAVQRVNALTEELVFLARMDGAQMPLTHVRLDVLEVVQAALRTLARTVQRRGVTLTVDIEPELVVTADAALFRRVVENLVDNAFRHVPTEGRVILRGQLQGTFVELQVGNTGRPVPEDERLRIFEKFARVSGSASRGSNVGLGLHFCQVVAREHGGTITVEETAAWPVLFIVRLPNADA